MNFNHWQFFPVEETPTPAPAPSTENVNNNSTAHIDNGWYYLKNTNSQRYLAVEGDKAVAGTNVCIFRGTGADGQKWYVENTSDGYITLKSGLGNFMLDIAYGKNEDGANIGIYHAYANDAQKFVVKNTKKSGVYTIGTFVSNATKYIDVYEHKTADGTNVCQWKYYGNPNQEWIFEPCQGPASAAQTENPTVQPTPAPTPTPSVSTKGLEATATVNSWGSGYTASVKVSNSTGHQVNGWTAKIKKSQVKIDSIWNVNLKESGDYYVITPVDWNTSIGNGGSVEFGFNGVGSVDNISIEIE
ncbi:MAG: RICIN domain-containing protein [Pseudobutyrivibrio sp.]|nr:RICIN domain-containing protein [Pseudobutyrivibrio sp.]